jgi:hypothetical protein
MEYGMDITKKWSSQKPGGTAIKRNNSSLAPPYGINTVSQHCSIADML